MLKSLQPLWQNTIHLKIEQRGTNMSCHGFRLAFVPKWKLAPHDDTLTSFCSSSFDLKSLAYERRCNNAQQGKEDTNDCFASLWCSSLPCPILLGYMTLKICRCQPPNSNRGNVYHICIPFFFQAALCHPMRQVRLLEKGLPKVIRHVRPSNV